MSGYQELILFSDLLSLGFGGVVKCLVDILLDCQLCIITTQAVTNKLLQVLPKGFQQGKKYPPVSRINGDPAHEVKYTIGEGIPL